MSQCVKVIPLLFNGLKQSQSKREREWRLEWNQHPESAPIKILLRNRQDRLFATLNSTSSHVNSGTAKNNAPNYEQEKTTTQLCWLMTVKTQIEFKINRFHNNRHTGNVLQRYNGLSCFTEDLWVYMAKGHTVRAGGGLHTHTYAWTHTPVSEDA